MVCALTTGLAWRTRAGRFGGELDWSSYVDGPRRRGGGERCTRCVFAVRTRRGLDDVSGSVGALQRRRAERLAGLLRFANRAYRRGRGWREGGVAPPLHSRDALPRRRSEHARDDRRVASTKR